MTMNAGVAIATTSVPWLAITGLVASWDREADISCAVTGRPRTTLVSIQSRKRLKDMLPKVIRTYVKLNLACEIHRLSILGLRSFARASSPCCLDDPHHPFAKCPKGGIRQHKPQRLKPELSVAKYGTLKSRPSTTRLTLRRDCNSCPDTNR